MRITAKQFALSLFESVDGKSAGEAKAIIKKFVGILVKKNKIAMAEKIINEINRVWNEKHGLVEATITSANELSKETARLLTGYIVKLSGAKGIKAEGKVDKSILGGVIIKYGDRVLDGSVRNNLRELREKLIK